MGANVRKVLLLVALILGVNGAWGQCQTGGVQTSGDGRYYTPIACGSYCGFSCDGVVSCPSSIVVTSYGNPVYLSNLDANGCSVQYIDGCNRPVRTCYYRNYKSITQDEADSIQCVNEGKEWVNGECKESGCTAEDSTNFSSLIARCDSLGGTNDYALVDNGAQGCGLSGFCNLCNGNSYEQIRKQQQKNCCEQGHAPDTTALKCVVESITSTDKTFNVSGANRCLSGDPQIIITPDGESYREGCDDPPPPTNSSNSGGSSSSESGMSSSSENGGDSLGLEWLKDSTHKIIMYDSTTAANSIDLVNYLYDIKTCLESGTCGGGAPIDYTGTINEVRDTLHHSNELLKQIANKDLSVQVNGGLTAEKQAELIANIGNVADSTAKYGIANGARLDSIIEALKHLGADSVAHGLDSVRNEYLREGIDSLYSLRVGLDSTFADWSDTTGAAAGGDTLGKGAELDALGDSLAGALWGYPCDTTGGKTCDDAYIGANGLENAKTAWSGAADALGDSLQSGAVNDSVNSWTNKLINNGVLSGNGSATCPAVFNRTWEIPIGRGSSYTFGPLGTMVCHDFGFGLTFWALARVLLRAMVAISCMWWLYRAVTGTDGGNNDED